MINVRAAPPYIDRENRDRTRELRPEILIILYLIKFSQRKSSQRADIKVAIEDENTYRANSLA